MGREYYLELAQQKIAVPIAIDLLVHEISDEERVGTDPKEMARVMTACAERFNIPLAIAPMDLRVEKRALTMLLGIDEHDADGFHLVEPLGEKKVNAVVDRLNREGLSARMQTTCDALQILAQEGKHTPVGMGIGPFSFLTKIAEDMIVAVLMISQGMTAEDDEAVGLALELLPLATELIERYLVAQVKAGASAIIICEPAANSVYISPAVMDAGSDIFERIVMEPNRRLIQAIEEAGGDVIFHDCGELTDEMIRLIGTLRPAVISFGSTTDLVKAAALVPEDVVLLGNVPSKHFPSEAEMPSEKVRGICQKLRHDLDATGHPYILGSECDILCVHGKEEAILRKAKIIAEFSGV